MARQRLVVVGNGMAGLRFVEEIIVRAPGRFDITVVGAEPVAAYNRVLLSALLAGEVAAADVLLRPREWYEAHAIELITDQTTEALDRRARQVRLQDRRTLAFDVLVLAMGSDPVRLTIPGSTLPGVATFRTLADSAAFAQFAAADRPAVVIGGGLLGIEAANALARRGVPVSLVHVADRLMERQLDAEGAALLAQAVAAKGVRILLNQSARAILGRHAVEAVELTDGCRLACGLVIMAVGIRPRTALASLGGLSTGRGIVVDDGMQTSHMGVFAIGECAEHRGTCYGLVEPCYQQAKVAAAVIAGEPQRYRGTVFATNLKVSGVAVFSAGDFEGVGADSIIVRDVGMASFRKLVTRQGRLTGAVLVGDIRDALWYRDLIRCGEPVAPIRQALAFGQAFAEAA
jgi:nitrite reductase [NAD(P)H] large subunit